MPGIYAALEIARKSLFVNQVAIQVTSHNVANANTVGYSRQTAVLVEANPQSSKPGQMGMGSMVETISRSSDSFIERQLTAENGSLAGLAYTATVLGQVEIIFNSNTGASLSDRINEFYNAWDDLTVNPQGSAERQTVVSMGQLLAAEFRRIDTQLVTLKQNANSDVETKLDDVNQLVSEISTLNSSIKIAYAQGQQPNDLLDQRSLALKNLAEKINFTTITDKQSQVNIYVGKGQAILEGETAGELVADVDTSSSDLLYAVRLRLPGQTTGTYVDITSDISGGELASAIGFRDDYIDEVARRVDSLAYAVATSTNVQHMSGWTLPTGTPATSLTGIDFFEPINDLTNAARNFFVGSEVDSDIRKVAAAGATNAFGALTVSTIPPDGSTVTIGGKTFEFNSTGAASAGNVLVGTSDAFLISLGLGGSTGAAVAKSLELSAAADKIINPTLYTVSARGGVAFVQADASGIAGNTIAISKTADPSGTFSLTGSVLTGGVDFPTSPPPVGDNRNAVVLAGLRNVASDILGQATVPDFIAGEIVGRVGSEAKGVNQDYTAQKTIVSYLEQRREEVSGVSLDEEMTNLIKFQRGFEASARMITLVDQLLNEIINLRQS